MNKNKTNCRNKCGCGNHVARGTSNYGIFYKSHGKWIGPYNNFLAPKSFLDNTVPEVKKFLKSKLSIRKCSKHTN